MLPCPLLILRRWIIVLSSCLHVFSNIRIAGRESQALKNENPDSLGNMVFGRLCPLLIIKILPLRVFDDLHCATMYGQTLRECVEHGMLLCIYSWSAFWVLRLYASLTGSCFCLIFFSFFVCLFFLLLISETFIFFSQLLSAFAWPSCSLCALYCLCFCCEPVTLLSWPILPQNPGVCLNLCY